MAVTNLRGKCHNGTLHKAEQINQGVEKRKNSYIANSTLLFRPEAVQKRTLSPQRAVHTFSLNATEIKRLIVKSVTHQAEIRGQTQV